MLIVSFIWVIDKGVVLISAKIFRRRFFGDFELLFNVWRVLFLFIVLVIRRCVIIFSCSYISGLFVRNFVALYLSFVIRIVWLIINNNFYWIIFGWDGLGVVSFLLIVFYINYERINNGLFTLFQNRVGDLFFVLFMLILIDIGIWTNSVVKVGLLFLLFGACVKRAQFPFNSWLLSAISAPTPISSLVHSSTLVVAGVFVLLQYSYCLVDFLDVLKFIRVLRLLISRFGLLNEFDIKKLIAYSTINHVSLIIYILSFKLFKVVYFHLNIHAMFKSLIFICFGFVILASYHSQDKRLVSFLYINPIIKVVYYFSCICLAGLPFLRGFFSKDFIIEKFIEFNGELLYICLLLLFLRISIYYRIKLLRLRENIFCYSIIDKRYVGIFSVLFMLLIIMSIINIYINLVFSLSLELLSFKIRIYFLILIFLFLAIFTNINFKLFSFEKTKNFCETWLLRVYSLDSFVYWNIYVRVYYFRIIRNVKIFLLMNWWVLILVVVFF